MSKVCLNSRDELLLIDLGKMAFLKANGNYTDLSYISGQTQTLSLSLSKMEEVIRVAGDKEGPGQFTRLGRSLIINRKYLVGISVLRQCVMLSDCEGHTHVVQVPKMILKKFKDMIAGGRREFID